LLVYLLKKPVHSRTAYKKYMLSEAEELVDVPFPMIDIPKSIHSLYNYYCIKSVAKATIRHINNHS